MGLNLSRKLTKWNESLAWWRWWLGWRQLNGLFGQGLRRQLRRRRSRFWRLFRLGSSWAIGNVFWTGGSFAADTGWLDGWDNTRRTNPSASSERETLTAHCCSLLGKGIVEILDRLVWSLLLWPLLLLKLSIVAISVRISPVRAFAICFRI